jgi:hypothetical protein
MRVELDSTKYVMATIRVPIEISMTGVQTIHSELYHIEYDVIDQLPDFPENRNTDQLSSIFSRIAETYDEEIEFKQTIDTPNHQPILRTTIDDSDMSDASVESDSESESEFVFKPEYGEDEDDEDEDDDSDTIDGFAYDDDETPHHSIPPIQFSQEIPDELMVRKDEIRRHRPFPKSKTFRRAHKPQSRFSRKSDTRFIRVPDAILQKISQPNSSGSS